MPTYTYATFAFAKQQVADRLFDSTKTFWTDTELGLYIKEALQTWNALTSFWRNDFLFNSVSGTRWYDLTNTTAMPNTLRPMTVTDRDLFTMMQYHLLEPIAWNPWTGVSLQFTADNLLEAVQRRRDEILSTTGCTQTRSTVGAVSGRIALNDKVIDVRRMAYLPNSPGVNTTVWPDDTWAEQSFDSLYTLNPAGTPDIYRMSIQPPISFEVNRPPAFAGNYELLTVNAGNDLVVASATILPIPNDWTHVNKWGALADLFAIESNAKDPLRQQYCEQRFQMGLKLLSQAPALMQLRCANVPVQIDSVRAADLYDVTWQSQSNAKPSRAYHSGLNLLALSAQPDAAYSMTATVVQNAPVPSLDADFIQLSRDDLDAIIDYAQHLAALKMGGQEFMNTIPLFQRFMERAKFYNARLSELGEYTSVLYGLSQREAQMNPLSTPVEVRGDS